MTTPEELKAAIAKPARVVGEVYPDDHTILVTFDATPWFEQATDEEITRLAKIEWGGNYESDAIAEYMVKQVPTIQEVFDYIHKSRGTRQAMGFECHVLGTRATAWIWQNRPVLARNLYEQGLIGEFPY